MAKILLCGGLASGKIVEWTTEPYGQRIVVPTTTVPPVWAPGSDKDGEFTEGLPTAEYMIGEVKLLDSRVWIATQMRDPDVNGSILQALLRPELHAQGMVRA